MSDKVKHKTVRALPYLKEYMQENKIFQVDIADMTGYSIDAISKFVRGKSGSRGMARVIARELEVDVELIAEVVYI